MSKRPLLFRQTDLARALKVADRVGNGWEVVVDKDGTIRLTKAGKGSGKPQEGGSFDDRPPMVF